MESEVRSFSGLKALSVPVVQVVTYAVVLAFFFRAALAYILVQWRADDFNYCYMIPPLVLYLVWEKRSRLASVPSVPSWVGLIPLALGIFCYWLGELAAEFTVLDLSMWLLAVGLCWLHLGWRKLKLIAFPLFFSLSMFAPPESFYGPVTLRLKLVSSQIGVKLLQWYGMSAYREGNVIDLGFTQLQVVDACSGLRYVIPLFIMGLLMAYYYQAPLWKRLVLLFSTVPLSIVTNSLRIASVGILYQFWGPSVAEGFFHDVSGWIIFMACMGILLGEIWLLKKIFPDRPREQATDERKSAAAHIPPAGEGDATALPQRARMASPHYLVALVLITASLASARTVSVGQTPTAARPLDALPLQLQEWSGRREVLGKEYLDALKLSDYAMVDYGNKEGKQVNCYVAYHASQTKGESTHSPATCLPSSGWVFNESAPVVVPTSTGGRGMQVSRAVMEKNGEKQLVYFWFPQRGRVLTSLYQIKVFNFWDALTRHRTDGALVRLITPVYQGEALAVAEERLRGFTARMVPVLDTYLPR